MQAAVLLAIAASFCTATASLAQRQGAKSVQTTGGFDIRLLLRLARQTGPWDLAGEALALALVVAGAATISHSCFIRGEAGDPSCLPAGIRTRAASRPRETHTAQR